MKKIVIEIDDELYNEILSRKYSKTRLEKAVANGTPLPKGHGRLMILSEDTVKERQIKLDFSCQKWISEVDLSYATVAIIEADDGR